MSMGGMMTREPGGEKNRAPSLCYEALPDMQGSGMVRDLSEAVSLSPALGNALAATVAQFAAGAYDTHQASIDSLIQQWSATSTFATTADGAYGARHLTLNLEGIITDSAAYNAFLDKLNTVERFCGRGAAQQRGTHWRTHCGCNDQTFRTIPAGPAANDGLWRMAA